MDRVGLGASGRFQNPLHIEVGIPGRRRPQLDGGIRRLYVRRDAVGLRIHGHRLDPLLVARPHDPERDLAAVGYEDAGRHKR